MKIRKIFLLPLLLAATLSSLISCGVDRWPEYAALTEQDEWIANTMRENYLWYSEMLPEKKMNFFLAPDAFLKAIVSQQDNGASYVDTIYKTLPPSYGFDYTLYRVEGNDTAYNALITYILPTSSAAKAGLKRGKWIMKVNDEYITKKSEPRLLNSNKAVSLLLGKYVRQMDEETDTEVGVIVQTGTAEMGAGEPIEDNPINYHRVLTASNGIKVGYLVYSHFTAGPTAGSQQYDDELRTISREFADAGVTYFILDLRYNTGGSMQCAQLLSTLVAPAESIGKPFANLEYNDKLTSKNHQLLFDNQLIGTGANLNIQQGFILTSSATAGISGTLLNCLIPLQRWGLVGSSITCNGVATEEFTDSRYPWSLNPVVCTVFNSAGESGRGGIAQPTASINETADLTKFLPFGDEKEALLSVTLGLIDGTYPPKEEEPIVQSAPVKTVIHTPSRKAPGRTTLR